MSLKQAMNLSVALSKLIKPSKEYKIKTKSDGGKRMPCLCLYSLVGLGALRTQ